VVAVLSLSGGTGRTTVTANLAQSLAMSGHRVLGIDLDPQNQLGMHFGLDPNERVGMGHASVAVKDVTTFVGRQQGAAVLPFGLLGETALEQTEGRVLQDRNWLRMRVEAFTPADCGFVLLDVPAGRGPWMRQALAIADQVLVVLDPRPAAYASIPATELVLTEALGSEAAAEASYLLNAFDGRSSIQRDLQSGLRAALGDRVVPVTIQHDEAVPEALLHRRSLLHHAVDSQVTADFAQLAEWLQGRWGTSELEAGVAGRMAG
jgi:cellulose synthase operon protein YhjQ